MFARSLILACLVSVIARPAAGFAGMRTGMRSASAFLSPRGRRAAVRSLPPSTAHSLKAGRSKDDQSKPTIISRRQLINLVYDNQPRLKEESRLQQEAWRLESEARKQAFDNRSEEDKRQEEDNKRRKENAALRDVDKFALEEVDKCVEECRDAAIRSASSRTSHVIWGLHDIAWAHECYDRSMNERMVDRLCVVMTRELSRRLPGVDFEFRYRSDGCCGPEEFCVEFDWTDLVELY